jgi:ABC-type nitrate/sulfonate/bicarbonate transport system substrate-binding protein
VGTIGSIDELPLFVIQDQALDAKHGFRVETSTFVGGAPMVEAMAGGLIDAGWSIGTVPLLAAAERGAVPDKVVAIATTAMSDPDHPGVGVVTGPEIEQWHDLRGRLIGVYVVNSLGGAAVRARLQREGVQDYRLVEIPLENLGLALASGIVSAVVMPKPFVSQAILRNDGKLLDWVIGGAPLDRMVYTLLAVSAPFHRERRDEPVMILGDPVRLQQVVTNLTTRIHATSWRCRWRSTAIGCSRRLLGARGSRSPLSSGRPS